MFLLVNTFEYTSPDPKLSYVLAKRGDVVAIHKHDESFGMSEILDPQWRIVFVPGISEIQANGFLVSEKAPPYTPTAPTRFRAFNLNLHKLPGFDRPRTATYDQNQDVRPDLIFTVQQITDATESKSFFDVNSIGPDTHVIG